ncbi:hypothetical protein Psfp_04075 [Pelotomaculum sp. FP]|uniref:hypothetical protein n=1 Tax=Pelotomaculum sp. FP TaxID=261474 RepID=UPI00110545B7|nr:hypothetical protein [Pelotomaculum sp. FP]TEB10919.1 hypothetical protein Psfp_04075 [Pelotomaculum sp. FP]
MSAYLVCHRRGSCNGDLINIDGIIDEYGRTSPRDVMLQIRGGLGQAGSLDPSQ